MIVLSGRMDGQGIVAPVRYLASYKELTMPHKYITRSLSERIAKSSAPNPSGCTEWIGALDHRGYGKMRVGNKLVGTHRVAWELEHGPIPEGMVIMHTCDNPRCIRVSHLKLGTQADNMRDKRDKGRSTIGERNSHAKLTRDDVIAIRAAHSGGESQLSIALRYGIDRNHVSNIVLRNRWKHI